MSVWKWIFILGDYKDYDNKPKYGYEKDYDYKPKYGYDRGYDRDYGYPSYRQSSYRKPYYYSRGRPYYDHAYDQRFYDLMADYHAYGGNANGVWLHWKFRDLKNKMFRFYVSIQIYILSSIWWFRVSVIRGQIDF